MYEGESLGPTRPPHKGEGKGVWCMVYSER